MQIIFSHSEFIENELFSAGNLLKNVGKTLSYIQCIIRNSCIHYLCSVESGCRNHSSFTKVSDNSSVKTEVKFHFRFELFQKIN